jgi:hypothetical protein
MRRGLIIPHTGCNVNVSRPSTLNRNSYVKKQNALNNDINQLIRTSKGLIDMKSSSTIYGSICDQSKRRELVRDKEKPNLGGCSNWNHHVAIRFKLIHQWI